MPNSVRPSGVSRPPKYSRQKRKGRPDRAYVRVDGNRIYLGNYGGSESWAKYAELIAGPVKEASAILSLSDPTINEILVAFLGYAKGYYANSSEYPSYLAIARLLRQQVGSIRACDFGPKALKQIRETMILKGWCRKSINKQVTRTRAIFAWAVGEELIPATNLAALQAVKGLRAGKSTAREKPSIRPVPDADIDATLAELSPLLVDMVRTHRLLGCRPSELLSMQPSLIDRSGPVWVYTPTHHKTQHLGKSRQIAIGPRAQAILQKYLFGVWCFQTPKGKAYRVNSYRNAILRAAKRASVTAWTPNRLRHNAATVIRAKYGIEAAQVVLGHTKAAITEVYAERDLFKAVEVARQIG